ncbi:MAG: glycosyltransferase [Phycisphaeraceae bacterium]|nr:MAG: glycosyltransferase [Phycisphaeraceae bacterium]
MLRIGQVIQNVESTQGGTSAAFVEIVSALSSQRGRASITAYAPQPPQGDAPGERLEAMSDIDWRPTGPAGGLRPGAMARSVIADIERDRLDIVHLHALWSTDLVAIASACRRKGVACCWMPHGMLMDFAIAQKRLKKQLFLTLGLSRALKHADGLLFTTAGERDCSETPTSFPREKMHIVGLPVEIVAQDDELPELAREGRERFGLPASARVVGFIGRLHPVKRLEMTLDAFARLGSDAGDVRLLLLGSGDEAYEKSLRNRAASLGALDRVVFAGWISGRDKWRGLAAADVVVVNSLHENFGYSIPEALAVGTPIVATENLAMSAEVRAAGVGRIAAPDTVSLAGAITETLADAGAAETARQGRAWVIDNFSHNAFGARLVDLFERIANR